ncbi:hypothetical protein D9M71_729020 [compost metagenome]
MSCSKSEGRTMSQSHTYAEIAQDFRLWQEYVDPDATMSEAEFDGRSSPTRP